MESLLRQAAETDKVLVMIFLDGGNDGLNTVVPLDRMSELNSVRPRVVLEESELLPLAQSEVGLHPSMLKLSRLYEENRFQIIQNVGYPEQNFSHFRSTDIWMSGSDANEVVASGWMGRNLEQTFPGYPEGYPNDDLKDPLAVEIGYGSSLLFQGVTSTTSVTVNSVDSFYELIDNVEQEAPDTPAGDKLKYLRLIARQSQQYGERIVEVAGNVNGHSPYPEGNYLADQLKVVSKLIAGGSRTPVYMVRLGGFDTHDSQVDSNHSEGFHAQLLTMLDDAIDAFVKDLEFHGTGDKVLGMTFSEFGRTVVSNASNGTDHGAAAPLFFFGNQVKGGVVGSNPVIDHHMRWEDNLAHQYDFRQLYASVMEQWFGLDTSRRNTVLFEDYSTVEIIGNGVIQPLGVTPETTLIAYPNPMNGVATIRFEGDGSSTLIELVDLKGQKLKEIYRGTARSGRNTLSFSSEDLASGRYFITLRSEKKKEVFGVIK